MPVFVTISEGPSAGQARPVLVLDDPAVARALGDLIAKRFGAVSPARSLRSMPDRLADGAEKNDPGER